LNKSTKLINELFDNYVSNYLTSYGSPYLTYTYICTFYRLMTHDVIDHLYSIVSLYDCTLITLQLALT